MCLIRPHCFSRSLSLTLCVMLLCVWWLVCFTFGGHFVYLCFWDRSSLSCPGRPWIYNPSAIVSWASEIIHCCHQVRLSLMPKFLNNTVLNPPIILIFVKCKIHYKGPVGISLCLCCDYAIERFLCLKFQLAICSKEDINSEGSLGGRGEAQLPLPRTQFREFVSQAQT